MTNAKDYREQLFQLLSLEYNCSPKAFSQRENLLTESWLQTGRRMYGEDPYFFHMVTLGANAVITADPCLHPFLQSYMKGRPGQWLFEVPNLLELERELNRFSYTLTQTHHMFLPSGRAEAKKCRESFDVKWYYENEFHGFYGDIRFPNAICESYLPERPDRIVVVACAGEEIMGMAGCSEDAPGWMQIGIDVLPGYRSQGVGTFLVTLLKHKIEDMGAIPFYGTSVSNYHSWNIALNSGFQPVWVEIGANRQSG